VDKIILTKEEIQDLVFQNHYPVEERQRFLSRCIDGRYKLSKMLPPLAFPGADLGELALLFATGNCYGFECDGKKTIETLVDVIGGVKNFQLHSDCHSNKKIPGSGCGHYKQINLDPKAYDLEKKQIDFIKKTMMEIKKAGVHETILEGEHLEGAMLFVKGDYSIYPGFSVEIGERTTNVQVFVYQTSLVNARHRALAEKLVKNNAVKLFPGNDAEYLYEVLSEMSENHLFETVKRLASGIPIYQVSFTADGNFEIEEMGEVV